LQSFSLTYGYSESGGWGEESAVAGIGKTLIGELDNRIARRIGTSR
jgi:hypothetical protein